jgi:hypothetical protein
MTKAGQYTKEIRLFVTPEMHQFLKLMAERHDTSLNDVVRQAIREQLDMQEDIITSRSRLGRTVMRQLGIMHSQVLQELRHLSTLLLAAVVVLLIEQGFDAGEAARRIANLARQPGLAKMLDAAK